MRIIATALLIAGAQPRTAVAQAPAQRASPPAGAVVAPVGDPCEGRPRCYSGGPFMAEVVAVTPSRVGGRHQVVEVRIRFRNLASQPVILGYLNASGGGVDNNRNRYYYGRPGTYDGSVRGMGLVTGQSADPQFVLKPGESRVASFSMIRYNSGSTAPGTSWSYEATIVQLEVLPGNQIRSAREYSLSFKDIR